MKYVFRAFLLSLFQQLRSWRTWLMVLLLPAVIFTVRQYLPAEEISAPVQVGVCLPEEGGDDFWDRLSLRSDTVITFLQADADMIQKKVSTGQWDCGLILAKDFDQRLAALDTDALITLYISPASTVYPLVQETTACTVMELISPVIARQYAAEQDFGDSLQHIDALAATQKVQIQLQTLSGQPLTTAALAENTSGNLLRGCMALLLLIWAVFSAMDLGSWFASPAALRMGMVRPPAMLLFPRAAAAMIPALFSAILGIVLLQDAAVALPALLGYLFLLTSLALVLCRFPAICAVLPCLIPFLTAAALLSSPILFDISTLFPKIAPVCDLLPVTLYLYASSGDLSALGILLLESLALLLIFLLTTLTHRKVPKAYQKRR